MTGRETTATRLALARSAAREERRAMPDRQGLRNRRCVARGGLRIQAEAPAHGERIRENPATADSRSHPEHADRESSRMEPMPERTATMGAAQLLRETLAASSADAALVECPRGPVSTLARDQLSASVLLRSEAMAQVRRRPVPCGVLAEPAEPLAEEDLYDVEPYARPGFR